MTEIQKENKTRKDFFEETFGFQLFAINNINTDKNLVVYDMDKKYLFFELNLIRVFEMIKNKDIYKFLRYLRVYFVESEQEGIVQGIDSMVKEKDIYKTREFVLVNQKTIFRTFRFKIAPFIEDCDVLSFYPQKERIVDNNGIKELNIYTNEYRLQKPTRPNYHKLGFSKIEFLLKNILQEGYEKFLDLLAWKIQKPLELIPSHWIIQDKGGTGKSEILIDFILSRLFNCEVIMQEDLESTFNGYIKNSEFLVCEEIEGYTNEKKMKVLTGAKYLTLNDKYSKTFKIRNYNNVIIFTNDIKGLKISYDDRRFNVVGGGKRLSPLEEDDWSETLFANKEENLKFFEEFHKDINVELWNLQEFLKNKSVDRIKIQIPLKNNRKTEMQKMNSTSEFEFLDELHELGFQGFIKEYTTIDFTKFLVEEIFVVDDEEGNKSTYISSKAMYLLYTQYCKKSNLKTISKNHFSRRAKGCPSFKEMFKNIELVSYQNSRLRAYEFKPQFTPND